MPRLQAAHRIAGGSVGFLGVDTKDDRGDALAFLNGRDISYAQVEDDKGHLLAALGVPGLPVTIVLDAAGTIVYRHVGELNWTKMRDALAAVNVVLPQAAPA